MRDPRHQQISSVTTTDLPPAIVTTHPSCCQKQNEGGSGGRKALRLSRTQHGRRPASPPVSRQLSHQRIAGIASPPVICQLSHQRIAGIASPPVSRQLSHQRIAGIVSVTPATPAEPPADRGYRGRLRKKPVTHGASSPTDAGACCSHLVVEKEIVEHDC